ncbi:hypothetical protein JX265_010920 [Neoarthrinium moseri]|uniref:Uncharacterized protein n=1 Tax=Neoarthrinium moseri TaxID=1658444 RepID=A0A9P9WDP8_9PEZI|nr:hypothetical protein JX265_010920 [Neoarthrinium moseri]
MLSHVIPLLALVASAHAAPNYDYKPPPPYPHCPHTICVDGINKCGIKYGACYDQCKPWKSPTPPPCSSTITVKPTTTKPTTTKPTTSTTDNCSTRTVCADYVNECGIWYGGCFPDCRPWPSFSKPTCPSTSTVSPTSKTSTPVTSKTPETTPTTTTTTRQNTSTGTVAPQTTATTTKIPETVTTSSPTTTSPTSFQPPLFCRFYTKTCVNSSITSELTFGPGCYTYRSGYEGPSYTTPYCAPTAGP